jgi:hypothetical protein
MNRQEEFAISRTCQNIVPENTPSRPAQFEETGKSKKTAQLCAEENKKHVREGPMHGEWPLQNP